MDQTKVKPLSEWTDKELFNEWNEGMILDSSYGLTKEQDEWLTFIERELSSRPQSYKKFEEIVSKLL
jgi:hypothetical protein